MTSPIVPEQRELTADDLARLGPVLLQLAAFAPDGLLVLDDGLVARYANRTATAVLGDVVGRALGEWQPDDATARLCADALRGATSAALAVEVDDRRYGLLALPLAGTAGERFVGLVLQAPTASSAARLSSLQQLTSRLAAAADVDAVAEAVCEHAGTGVGADMALLHRLDEADDVFVLLAAHGLAPDALARWRRVPASVDLPVGDAVRRREPVLLRDTADRVAHYPALDGVPSVMQAHAIVPLVVDGRALGSLTLGWLPPHAFTGEEHDFLVAVAGQCAQALDRARLFEAERAARAAAESTAARLAVLADAGRVLGSSLDLEQTLAAVSRLLVGRFADMVAVHLADSDGARLVTVAHSDPALADLARRLETGCPDDVATVLATGEPVHLSDLASLDDPVVQAALAEMPVDRRTATRALRATSHMVVPLTTRRGVVGALSLCTGEFGSAHRYTDDDLALAVELGRRIAVAVDNARGHEALSDVAVTLQRSLLPHDLPAVPSLGIAHRYVPGASAAQVGGDWYDVIPLSADRVALVIGDVMGRGVRAAAVMGQLRAALRAYAALDPPPEVLLGHLDGVVHSVDDSALVTCLYAVYEPGLRRLTVANAGHLPPLLVDADGVRLLDVPPAVPLGVGGVDFTSTVVELPPAGTLLLYTDGLVESSSRPVDAGTAAVVDVLRSSPTGDPDAVADGVLTALCPADGFADDVALLAVEIREAVPDTVVEATVRAAPPGAGEGRAFVVATLRRWGATHLADVAALLTSEVVTNAIRHAAGGLVHVRVRRGTDAVHVEVGDADPRLPRLHRASADDEGGRGLQLIDLLAQRWGARLTAEGKVVWFSLAL